MRRMLLRLMLGLVCGAAIGYALDWGVWRVRAGRNAGYGQVPVTRFVVAPLKGGREEYYADGTTNERCSRSIVSQGGLRACWWVERHRVVWDR